MNSEHFQKFWLDSNAVMALTQQKLAIQSLVIEDKITILPLTIQGAKIFG
jgi:hypothetical protein